MKRIIDTRRPGADRQTEDGMVLYDQKIPDKYAFVTQLSFLKTRMERNIRHFTTS